jgi:hypothetical protein
MTMTEQEQQELIDKQVTKYRRAGLNDEDIELILAPLSDIVDDKVLLFRALAAKDKFNDFARQERAESRAKEQTEYNKSFKKKIFARTDS